MSTTTIEQKALLALIKQTTPSITKWLKSLKEDFDHYCEHKFLPYFVRQYNQLNNTNSVISKHKKFKIDEIYEPLYIRRSSEHFNTVLIDSYPLHLFERNNRILICDSAGMGKSTLLKMIYRFAIDKAAILPFFIDIKSLSDSNGISTVEDYIIKTFPSFTNAPTKEFFFKLLDENPFLFIFDGADEVSESDKKEVFMNINRFVSKIPKSKVIISTREEEKIIYSFSEFEVYNVEKLTFDQACNILRKYSEDKTITNNLISDLKKPENEPVLEFLTNPLLTTLLHTAYLHKRKIPLKKSQFFKQIYAALFEDHDGTKSNYFDREKACGLDIDDFEKVVSWIAFISRPTEKLSYSRQEIVNLLKDFNDDHPTISFSPNDFLKDLVLSVPLFRIENKEYYWQHKSIQEYFFMRHILMMNDKEFKKNCIKKLINSKNSYRYQVAFEILFDEDEQLFHDVATRHVYEKLSSRLEYMEEEGEFWSFNCFSRVGCWSNDYLKRIIGDRDDWEALEDFSQSIVNDPTFILSTLSYSNKNITILLISDNAILSVLQRNNLIFMNYSVGQHYGARRELASNIDVMKCDFNPLLESDNILIPKRVLNKNYRVDYTRLKIYLDEFDKKVKSLNIKNKDIPDF